jgi:hypothetical protein
VPAFLALAAQSRGAVLDLIWLHTSPEAGGCSRYIVFHRRETVLHLRERRCYTCSCMLNALSQRPSLRGELGAGLKTHSSLTFPPAVQSPPTDSKHPTIPTLQQLLTMMSPGRRTSPIDVLDLKAQLAYATTNLAAKHRYEESEKVKKIGVDMFGQETFFAALESAQVTVNGQRNDSPYCYGYASPRRCDAANSNKEDAADGPVAGSELTPAQQEAREAYQRSMEV